MSHCTKCGRDMGWANSTSTGLCALCMWHPTPDNHHNALVCPYCNPKGLVLADPAPLSGAITLQELIERARTEVAQLAQVQRLHTVPSLTVWGWLNELSALLEGITREEQKDDLTRSVKPDPFPSPQHAPTNKKGS